MSNYLKYKGYVGDIEYSEEDNLLYGKVLGIRSLVSYEGESVDELVWDFHNSVDEYLQDCEQRNIKPESSYKGQFSVRIKPELHRKIALYALSNSKSLNACVEEALIQYEEGLALV